jgi:F0F1-type ATP synthase membrane subunit a
MKAHLDRAHRALPLLLAALTLLSVVVLLVWDAAPALFPARAHDLLGALPLALIALAYLVYQSIRRPGPQELFKAVLLSIAFLLWAANQLWPSSPRANLYNDLAIALFVLDVFFVIAGQVARSCISPQILPQWIVPHPSRALCGLGGEARPFPLLEP